MHHSRLTPARPFGVALASWRAALWLVLYGCSPTTTRDASVEQGVNADAFSPPAVVYRACVRDVRDPAGGFCDATERWGVHERFVAPPTRAEDGLKGVFAVADFDGDGRPDLFTSLAASLRPALLLNRGDHFENVSVAWGVDAIDPVKAVASVDLDGDGDPDLVLASGSDDAVTVYRNDGDHFAAHAADLQLDQPGEIDAIVPADLDHDGQLDLLVGVYRYGSGCTTTLPGNECPGGVAAFRQSAPMSFSRLSVSLTPRRVQGLRMFDWDDDGQDDVLVAVDFGMFDAAPNALLRVERPSGGGDIALRDATFGTGFDHAIFGMGLTVLDVDGDGRDEVAISNIGRNVLLRRESGRVRDVARELGGDAYGMAIAGELPRFRALDPDHPVEGQFARFEANYFDVLSPLFPTTKWPSVLIDYDDDGVDDLFVPAGGAVTDYFPIAKNQQSTMLRGTGGRFEDVTSSIALGQRHDARIAIAADFDRDGDLDLAILETAIHAIDGGLRLLRNDAAESHSLTVIAQGRGMARDGIGAIVELNLGTRTVHKRVDGSLSLFGSGPHEAHFGLGAVTEVDAVVVRFPSGAVVRRDHVPAGRVVIAE